MFHFLASVPKPGYQKSHTVPYNLTVFLRRKELKVLLRINSRTEKRKKYPVEKIMSQQKFR